MMSNAFDNYDDMEIYEDYNYEADVPEEKEFVPLAPGTYEFQVSEVKLGEFVPGEFSKAPACKKVTVVVTITEGDYDYFVYKDFLLYSKMNWLIRDFFISIGMGTKGEKFKVDWKGALHRKGLCETSTYEAKNGKTYVNIDKFIEPPTPF